MILKLFRFDEYPNALRIQLRKREKEVMSKLHIRDISLMQLEIEQSEERGEYQI